MAICGIVAEYDPFHLGHLHQIEASRAMGAEKIVVVMSGSFTQRGSAAIMSKFKRAEIAAKCGADLVLELPLPYAIASAERFARGAVATLAAAGCDMISFGSECGDIEALKNAAAFAGDREILMKARAISEAEGITFPAARARAVAEKDSEAAEVLASPNNLLGCEYIRAISDLGLSMTPVTVKRLGAGHGGSPSGSTASASYIRELLRQGGDPSPYLPPESSAIIEEEAAKGHISMGLERAEAALLLALRTMGKNDFASVPDCPGGLGDRIFAAASEARSMEELCAAAKTRRYTMTRVKRAALAAALAVDSSLTTSLPPYLRILAVGRGGRAIMASLAKGGGLPCSQSLAALERSGSRASAFANLERRAFELHCLTMPSPLSRGEHLQKIYICQEDR